MSRLGKSFKNRFLRRALAMVLAGTMVLSGMPVSFAAETSGAETSVEAEVQGGTEAVSEEAAEDGEVSQKESSEVKKEESENGITTEASETVSTKMSETVEESKEVVSSNTDISETVSETESFVNEIEASETETDAEEIETEQTTEEENGDYSLDSAALVDGHTYAEWSYTGETLLNNADKAVSSIQSTSSDKIGIYKNKAGDSLYIDASNGKFAPNDTDTNKRIQIGANTKIYIPVKVDNKVAKIIIYQSGLNKEEYLTTATTDGDGAARSYFAISEAGGNSVEAKCTAFGLGETVDTKKYYKAEWTCTLNTTADSATICVEVKGKENYVTKIISGEEVKAPRDDVYEDSAGDSDALRQYAMEGYAKAYGVTGGGVMKIDEANYHKVSTAEGFLQALVDIKKTSGPAVIRITKDLNLGSAEVPNFETYSSVIKEHTQALMHPTLKIEKDEKGKIISGTGVSKLTLDGFKDLTIFSTNGAAIKHCAIVISGSENIVLRNLVFDELWEWDDEVTLELNDKGEVKANTGEYDRNDWDYMCVDGSDGVWIDHCTFYKAYDGVVDVKEPTGDGEDERVTVSWCKFEPMSAPKTVDGKVTHPFYDAQIEWLENNIVNTNYYRALKSDTDISYTGTYTDSNEVEQTATVDLKGESYTKDDIITYTSGQKKTHLLGHSDSASSKKGIRVTLANNSYKNSMDRLPRLRWGIAHEYNCVLDSSELYAKKNTTGGSHLTSNGAISTTENAYLFLENCYIDGIVRPLMSGNSSSKQGHIGSDGCIYKLGSDTPKLTPIDNYKNGVENNPRIVDKATFKEKLVNYGDYTLYEASELDTKVIPYAGAGVVSMTDLQWTKVSYGDGTTDDSNPTNWAPSADNDPSEDDGSIEPPEPDKPIDPPAEQNDKEFRADALETQTALTADLKVNDYFTVTTGCEVAEGTATVNDIDFTKYIKFSATGSKENSIQITASTKGTLIVYVASNSESDARTVKLLDSTGSVVSDFASDVTTAEAVTLQIPEAGVYYVASADGELYVYGIDLNEDEGSGEENPTIEFSLSADDIHLTIENDKKQPRTLNEDYRRTGFTIKATSGNTVTVDESKKTVDGIKFTQRIKLGSKGDANSRSIRFKAETAGTLTVFGASASSSEAREFQLYQVGSTAKPLTVDAPTGNPVKRTFEITEPGEYYVTGNGGVNICYIKFSNKTEEPTPPSSDYAPEEVDAEWTTLPALVAESAYNADDAKDASKVMYNLEGYAGAANVTGGGLIKEGTTGYYKVTNEKEFLEALSEVQGVTDKPNVIEITTDLNLGKLELKEKFGLNILAKGEKPAEGETADFSGVIKAYTIQPRMHPTLKKTGVSFLNMHGFQNLTIFSKNGATIKHAGMKFEDASTKNIIIRNLAFDELWEWDEGGTDAKGKEQKPGDYDINDWDYMVIDEHAEGIWIDHCTFYKAYDGLIDIKNNSNDSNYYQRVTISWCEFLPGSKDNVFFNAQMKWLEDNIDNKEENIAYYRKLREELMDDSTETMSAKDVWWYAYGQKKAHLLGSADTASEDKVMRVTFANNYYKNAMSRLPRLRFGKVHEYNCVFDSQQMNEQNNKGNPHITGNGAISACKGEMLLENNYIRGVRTPLRSGYSSSGDDTGYINFINGVYYMDGQKKTPTITGSSGGIKTTDEKIFKDKLPEGYVFTTRDATQLYKTVVPYAGAGKLDMTIVQWEATNYGTNDTGSETPASPEQTEPAIPSEYDKAPTTPWDNPENPDNPNPPAETITVDAPTASPAEEMQFPSTGGKITLNCATSDAAIYYTMSDTEAGLTDPADAENKNRKEYVKDTEIEITKETYIWAVAVKDSKTSEPLKCHYTVAAEGAVLKPFATPSPAKPVKSGTRITLSSTGEFDAIYYTKGATPDAAADPTKEDSGREPYNKETGIIITEAVTIKAVAQKGDKYSDVVTLTYTIAADTPGDKQKVKAPTANPEAGAVTEGTEVRLKSDTEDAVIYYTTDNTAPTADSNLYEDAKPIIITEPVTIMAFAVKEGMEDSEVVSFAYTITNEPVVDPDKPEIKKININNCTITVPSAIYNKKAGNKQSVTYVTYKYTDASGNKKFVKFAEDVDYDATWEKTGANDYKVTLKGKGRSADGRDVDGFIIDENSQTEPITYKVFTSAKDSGLVNISKAKVDFKANVKTKLKTATYTGYAYDISVEDLDFSKDKIGLGKISKDHLRIACRNNINAGKATVTISVDPKYEDGKYAGSKTLTFTIKKAALNKNTAKATATVDFDKTASAAQQYMGDSIEAKGLVVTAKNGIKLRKNEDYTVTYKNSVKAGAATVSMTVKGVGNNLSGSWTGSFTIKQLDLADKTLTFDTNDGKLPYSPKGAKFGTITVTKDENICTLRPGVDYTAKYEYTDKAKKYNVGGKVTVTITGKGLCKGTTTFKDLEIIPADFDKHIKVSDDVTVDKDAYIANKDKAFAKAVTVTDASGVKLSLNKDYKITDIKSGSETEAKTFTIQPIGKNAANYTGTKTVPYRMAKNLAKDKNFIFNKDLEKKDPLAYDGRNPVKLTAADIDKYINKGGTRTYILGGENANIEIVPGTYKNNAKKGTAQVTVRGIAGVDGGFYGQKVLKFKIVEK